MGVVSIGDLCDGLAACVGKRKQIFFSIQFNSGQNHVFGELAEVGRERLLRHNGP